MPEADIAELLKVEEGETLGEELAVDDPLAKARDDAETDAAGEFVERRADAAEVVALDVLKAVAEHHPVDTLPSLLGALRAAVPDQLGVEARFRDLVTLRIHLADEIEVDEAVVHRRDQRVSTQ